MTQSSTGHNFALTGVGGYIAPRHLQAIKDTGNTLVAAVDPNDSVGIMDRYFFEASFFREFERFDRHIEKLRRHDPDNRVNYVSICAPNHLHDAHVRFALRVGADAICEKPLVLNPWNVDALEELAEEHGQSIYNILQLRLHPSIVALRDKIAAGPKEHVYDIDLTYITSRGRWYLISWKGDVEESGGVTTNIGIHFFDMLMWVFGVAEHSEVHISEPRRAAGYIELERARVRWFLSIDNKDLPREIAAKGQTTYRSITVDGEEIEFSGGFTDLHTRVYEEILAGRGFSPADARPSINLAYDIRHAESTGIHPNSHYMLRK
jgi:UDP-N-acetyl-2-amino-2-deoxyglucuronate dehydrogenase